MASDEMMRALKGSIEGLTPNATNIIRIFFSSTFTDMTEERNLLMRDAVPYLKSYCQEKGFDLEIVDMRWGVRDGATTDQATTDICLRAIEICQKISEGPNFVLFLGNRYGSRPLPSAISVTEFRLFRRLAYWMELNYETIEKWYLLDTNAVPPEYKILPITTLLPFYNNMNPVNQTRRLVHMDNWNSDERNMKNVIRKVALMALQQGKITPEQCDRYFISVTEAEVAKGLLQYGHLQDKVLCFQRCLLEMNLSDPLARRFIDLTNDGDIDQDAQDMLQKLSSVKIPKVLPHGQMIENSLNWSPKGIDPQDDTHGRYLEMFCEWFKSLLKEQIDNAIMRCNENKLKNDIHAEVTRHLATVNSKCQCFFGQEELINQVFQLLQKTVDEKKEETPAVPVVAETKDESSKDYDENNALESERKSAEPEEPIEGNGFTPNEVKNEIYSEQDCKEKENENPEKEGKDTNENEDSSQSDTIVGNLHTFAKSLGSNGPTVGNAFIGHDRMSDPQINIRDELICYKATKDRKYPIVIFGESGSGKTAAMAHIATLIKKWQPNAVVVIRFLGTTAQSKNIRDVLISIIRNIWLAYKMAPPGDLDMTSDIIYLGQYLQALIWQLSTEEQPLYIFLDSLDQLASLEQAHSLAWLPTILPNFGSVLLSTLPDHNGILESARRVLPHPQQFVEVPAFEEPAAVKVIISTCNRKSRSITRPQRNFLIERFRECPTPLFLKLITDQALSWRSHMVVKDLLLGANVSHAITHLMMNLERNHGIILVARAFGYISSMKEGATFSEITDLLSLDNKVLQDTFIYHLPPDPINIRFPTSVWSMLWHDVMEYLTTEGTSYGTMIMTWYHRSFHEACIERFLTEESSKEIHCLAAQYFLGYWHNKYKPLKLFKEKKGWYPENIRQVASQTLHFKDGRLNYRKLKELPHHLSHAGMWREFHKEIVCNIDFLVAKAQAFGVTELRADLMNFLAHRFEFTEEILKDDVDEPPSEDEEDGEDEAKNKEEEKSEEKEDQMVDDAGNINDELFLTENKKDVSVRNLSPEVTKTTSPVEEIMENTHKADLEAVLRDVEILIDIVNLGIDTIKQNALSLPSQIICQLGKDKAPTPTLQNLVKDCFEYLDDHEKPLMKPLDACMAMPGGMLLTSVNINIYLPSGDCNQNSPFQFKAANFYLHAIEKISQKKDTLIVLDMAQGGEKVMMVNVDAYVHSLRFNKNCRYLILCCYKDMSQYRPDFFYKLYEGSQLAEYHIDKETLSMDVSAEGDIVAYADDRCCYICSPKRDQLTLEVIYKLHNTESIASVQFSSDAYYLLTFDKNSGFKVWIPRRGESTLSIEGSSNSIFSSLSHSQVVSHITRTHRLLQVQTDYKKMDTVFIYNLSSGELIHELRSPELTYKIDIMETDAEEEYVIVATQDSGMLNGGRAKSAILWDIETGKVVSRVSSVDCFLTIKLLVDSNTIYIIAVQRSSLIHVYSVGLRHRPLAGAKLIRTLKGHSLNIMQISVIIPEGSGGGQRLVSASQDNTVKFWDLQQVLTSEPKETEKDIGQTTRLAISKDSRSIFYGTKNGHVEQMFISSGEKKCFVTNFEKPITHLLVSKNGKLLIVVSMNMLNVYYIENGELEYTLESCQPRHVSCIAESNNILIAGHAGMEGKGRIWDLSNVFAGGHGHIRHLLDISTVDGWLHGVPGRIINDVEYLYAFYQTAVSPSGTQYGVTMFEYPIMMDVFGSGENETNHGVQMDQVDSQMAGCSRLEFSPDGKMLVSSSVDGRIRVIDTETGRYMHTMIHPSSVIHLIFSWDSNLLLTAGFKSVYIWNIGQKHPDDEKGQLKVKLTRHGDFITYMKLVLDDRFLVTGSRDKSIALWSMKHKTTIFCFRAHCPIDIESMIVASDLSSISFIPGQSASVAILTLNKAAKEALKEIPDKLVPTRVKKAQSVALSFSTQEVTQKTSVACSIL